MDPKIKYKAEDFLSDRIPEDQQHLISPSEMELAGEIKEVFKNLGTERLTDLEREEMWTNISAAASSKSKMRITRRMIFQIAASLFIIMAFGYWLYDRNTPTSKLLNFAAQNVNKKSATLLNTPHADRGDNDNVLSDDEKDNIITANEFNTLVVGNGQRSVIRLSDGTKVWLNSNSRLIYPISFNGNTREIYLEGQAYFDVFHDVKRPFFVRTKNMDIKVLGTEFYVSSNDINQENYAVLVNGSIAFSAGSWLNKTELKLTPGERVNLDVAERKIKVSQVEVSSFQSWKEGYLDVQSESLDSIIAKIAKYYNIEIDVSGLMLSDEKFSGRLDFQRSAGDVLSILCTGTPYQYNEKERRLELRTN